jgi:hypothetical protein
MILGHGVGLFAIGVATVVMALCVRTFGVRLGALAALVATLGVIGIEALRAAAQPPLIWALPLAVLGGLAVGAAVPLRAPESRRLDPFVARLRRNLADARLLALLVALLVAIALTAVWGGLMRREGTAGFWFAFYSSWTASLAFFGVVGVIGVAVSLSRPEREVFRARARILFGGREGPAVDYISEKLRKIGYFSTDAHRRYVVEDYDAQRKAYRVRVTHTTTIKNFFDDVKAEDVTEFGITPDPIDPAPVPYGEFVSWKIGAENLLTAPQPFGVEGVSRAERVEIPAGESIRIETEFWAWLAIVEEHSFSAARFVEQLTTEIVYRCNTPNQGPTIRIEGSGGLPVARKLVYDEPLEFPKIRNARPETEAYKFTLSIPE